MDDGLADEDAIERVGVQGRELRDVQRGCFVDGQRVESRSARATWAGTDRAAREASDRPRPCLIAISHADWPR